MDIDLCAVLLAGVVIVYRCMLATKTATPISQPMLGRSLVAIAKCKVFTNHAEQHFTT